MEGNNQTVVERKFKTIFSWKSNCKWFVTKQVVTWCIFSLNVSVKVGITLDIAFLF